MKKLLTAACAVSVAAAPLMALAPVAVADGIPAPDHHRPVNLHAKLDPFKVNRVDGAGLREGAPQGSSCDGPKWTSPPAKRRHGSSASAAGRLAS